MEQRIATVDAAGGEVRQVSPADLYVYEYALVSRWQEFAATAAHGSGDNNWYIAEVYVVDRDTGECRSILKPNMQIAVPRWSKNGRAIGFIGGLMSDESVASGDLYVISASGGQPRNLTPDGSGSTFWFTWLPNCKRSWPRTRSTAPAPHRSERNSRSARTLWQGGNHHGSRRLRARCVGRRGWQDDRRHPRILQRAADSVAR